jgi:hypothetical protein
MAPNSKSNTPPPIPDGIPDVFKLDEQKIQATENTEKQELYVLQWLAQVEREIKAIDVVSLSCVVKEMDSNVFHG